jgi:hypothetical protein
MVEGPLGPGWERHNPVSASLAWARAGGAGIEGIWEVSLRVPRSAKAIKGDRATLARFWKAVLKASKELNVYGLLARSIARELAHDLGSDIIVSEERRSDRVRVVASHLCGEACGGVVGQCLTALMVEVVIQEKTSEPFLASGCKAEAGGTCEVILLPWRFESKPAHEAEGLEERIGPIAISP